MLSFSLFPALLHSLILLLPKSTEILFCSIRLFPGSLLPLRRLCRIFVPFERMSLPSVLNSDQLFRIFSKEQTDADWCRVIRNQDLIHVQSSVLNWYLVLYMVFCGWRSLYTYLHLYYAAPKHKNTKKIRWHNLFSQADPGVIYPNHTSVSFRQLQRSSTRTAAIFSITQMFTHSAGSALLRGIAFNQLHCFSLYSPAHAVPGDVSARLLAVQCGGR